MEIEGKLSCMDLPMEFRPKRAADKEVEASQEFRTESGGAYRVD